MNANLTHNADVAEAKAVLESLTPNAQELFRLYVLDAPNWSGTPCVGHNVALLGEREDRGLLTHLKRAGLVRTEKYEGSPFVYFEPAGRLAAEALGLSRYLPE